MRWTFLLTAFMIWTGFTGLQSQDISNSGFESWTLVQYFEDPDGYSTTNTVTYFGGSAPNVTKTTDAQSGNYAIRMETIDTPDGVLEGAAFIGEPGEGNFIGGMPYVDRPDSLTGYVKYNVNTEDTAYVAAIFKKFGVPIGVTFAQFTGVQNDYMYFSVPVEWLVPIISPDTLAIAIISSSIFTEPTAGNVLYVDNVQFVGEGAPFPNGNFENWTDLTSDEPDEWQSTNIFTMPASSISVSKTTDSHSGNYAAKLVTQYTNWYDTVAFITNGTIGDDGPAGGMPVEDIPAVLSGYYKYVPSGPDSAIAILTLYHYNAGTGASEEIDKTTLKLPATNTYTYFELTVDYYSIPEPDTVNISFGSGNFEEAGAYIGLGSTLYIDDLEITYKPHLVAVKEQKIPGEARVYPNPARETVYFELPGPSTSPVVVKVYNNYGAIVAAETSLDPGRISLSVNNLPHGIYVYRIERDGEIHSGTFALE